MKLEVERVRLGDLRPFPGNARRGNVDAIAESLRVNGEYQPIVAQRSTGYVLIGNHRLQAAQKLGWTHLNVVYRDVDDDAARRIVVADNRTHDLGSYDERALAELLRSLEDELQGTGYEIDDVDDLLAALEEEDARNPPPPPDPTVLVPLGDPPAGSSSGLSTSAAGGTAPGVRQTPTMKDYEERYADAATRFLALIFPIAQYVWVVDKLQEIGRTMGGDPSNSAVLLHLVEQHTGDTAPE